MSIKINGKNVQKGQINGKEIQKIVINGNTVYELLAPVINCDYVYASGSNNGSNQSKTVTCPGTYKNRVALYAGYNSYNGVNLSSTITTGVKYQNNMSSNSVTMYYNGMNKMIIYEFEKAISSYTVISTYRDSNAQPKYTLTLDDGYYVMFAACISTFYIYRDESDLSNAQVIYHSLSNNMSSAFVKINGQKTITFGGRTFHPTSGSASATSEYYYVVKLVFAD